jgi:hypothetical protein
LASRLLSNKSWADIERTVASAERDGRPHRETRELIAGTVPHLDRLRLRPGPVGPS